MIMYNSVKFKDRKSFDKNKKKKNVRAVIEEAGIIVFKDRVPVTPDKNKVSHTYSFGNLKKGIPTPTVYLRAISYLPAVDFCNKNNIRIIQEMPKVNWLAVELPEHVTFERFHAVAIQSELFYMVEQFVTTGVTPTAINYTYNQIYQLPALRCQEAWDYIAANPGLPSGQNNVVTVVDWGCDINHPDMVGQTVNNFNMSTGTTNVQPVNGDTHGMGASSQIVAKNDGTYAIGVSPYDTKVSFVYVGSSQIVNGDSLGIFSYGLYHCMQMPNCIATSNSYLYGNYANPSGPRPFDQQMVYDALLYGRGGDANTVPPTIGKGVLAFCANGNGPSNGGTAAPPNRPIYPASYDGTVVVTATEPFNGDFRKTFWADYGNMTFCGAPGKSTPSSAPNNETMLFGGTSGATPLTAGVAALIHSAVPNLSANGIKDVIKNSCRKIYNYDYNIDPANPGKSIEVGYGQVDAYSAVVYATSGVIDPGPGLTQNLRVLVSGPSQVTVDTQYTLQYSLLITVPQTVDTTFTVTIFYSTTPTYTGTEPVLTTLNITIPANNWSYQSTYTFTVPNTLSGNYYFGVHSTPIAGEPNLDDNVGFVDVNIRGNVVPAGLNLRVELDTVAFNPLTDNTVQVSYELENTGITPITTFTLKKGFVGYEEREFRLEIPLETDEIINIIDTWSNIPPINVIYNTPFQIEITSVNNLPLDDNASDNISSGYIFATPPTP